MPAFYFICAGRVDTQCSETTQCKEKVLLAPCQQNLLMREVKIAQIQRKTFTESKFVLFQRQLNAITLDARS